MNHLIELSDIHRYTISSPEKRVTAAAYTEKTILERMYF